MIKVRMRVRVRVKVRVIMMRRADPIDMWYEEGE